MKKNIWIWALAATTLFAACSSKDDDPIAQGEPDQIVTEDDFEGPNGQVVVQLGGGDYLPTGNATVTRTPLSNTTFTNGNTIVGIYAASTTGAWNQAGNLLLDNRKAKVTDTKRTEDEGADTSKEAAGDPDSGIPAVTAPYKISLFDAAGATEGKVEYYPMVSNKNYAFYGYAPFDTKYTTATNTGGATVTFTGFDGSQDIIWGTGTAKQISAGDIWAKSDYSTNPTEINGYNAKYIRMLKYHYQLNKSVPGDKTAKSNYPWIPNISFTHKLVQFIFHVIPAKEQSDEDKENAKKLYVSNIRLQNHGTPTLSINDGSLTFSGNNALQMRAINGETFTDTPLNTSVKPTDNQKVGYLLVKPGQTSYDLLIDISPFNDNGTENTDQKQTDVPVKITLPGGATTFDAGCSYNIKLGIYAMQEVKADASLTEWIDKGDVNIDVE